MNSAKNLSGFIRLLLAIPFALFLHNCSDPKSGIPGWIDQTRMLLADQQPENWMSLGRDFKQLHFSPLQKINENNVKDLGCCVCA